MVIVVALDSLHEDFDTTTASPLKAGDKTIDQIQSIFQLKEVKNLSKRATGDTGDLAMTFRDKSPRRKANSNEECYNYHKFGHFERDCFLPDKKLNRNTQQSRRKKSRKGDSRRDRSGTRDSTPNQEHQATENKSTRYENDSNPEPFTSRFVGIVFMVKERLQRLGANGIWFLDSCAFRHLCNDRKLFSNLKLKNINFVTVVG